MPAKRGGPRRDASGMRVARHVARSIASLALAGLAMRVSQLGLSPLYGSLPVSSLYHDLLPFLAAVLALGVRALGVAPSASLLGVVLPIHAALTPGLLFYVFAPASSWLGARNGPIVTEACTVLPTLVLTFCLSLACFDGVSVGPVGGFWRDLVVMPASVGVTMGAGIAAERWLVPQVGMSVFTSRWALETAVSGAYVLLYPSRLVFVTLPAAALFLLHASPHGHLPGNVRSLDRNLAKAGFALLDRQESVTGYVSVVQSEEDQFRVMRCDHSLLGGYWLPTEQRRLEGVTTEEPVFPVFTMLEAVRLLQHTLGAPNQNALVIGLGAGTSPAALSMHGLDTTAVELDPAVTALSRKYFGLPDNVTMVHGDALEEIPRLRHSFLKFDYMVHDVFTGGAQPMSLFTVDFLEYLRFMLKPRGAIAINYAGDLKLTSTTMVLDTIASVFASCKAYRDDEPPVDDGRTTDPANIVVFCTKQKSDLSFRAPVEADFLGSQARRLSMMPQHELDLNALPREGGGKRQTLDRAFMQDEAGLKTLAAQQKASAETHWSLMRMALPLEVWANW